ncbi:MAG: D-alanine--D-alanine ligase [Deltaproteobacteria bacterium]|nr:D-alanine--D-alanine ligase [Deltaproteobacteria bacterium]
MAAGKKRDIAVLYGGRSVEHEISVITALQLMKALDPVKYNVIPVYIAPSGRWYTGNSLFEKNCYRNWASCQHTLTAVSLQPWPGIGGLKVEGGSLLKRFSTLLTGRFDTIPVDVFLLAFHGEYGEDGCIQGLLEMAEFPYTSCDVTSSAIAMNKYLCKSILRDHGIKVLPSKVARKFDAIHNLKSVTDSILQTPGLERFPLFIKPNHLGSSIGIAKAEDIESLHAALAKVFLYDTEAIVEPCLESMFEINVSVISSDPTRASVVEIPVATSGALSYEDKYMRGGGKKKGARSQGMASLVREIDPAALDSTIKEQVTSSALKAFEVLGCCGVVRFDFMHDNTDGSIYFNELNPQPGSLSFYLWVKSNPRFLYTEELDVLIESALKRRSQLASRERELGFMALK